MSELLEFKSHKRLTAMGRFLLVVEQQEDELVAKEREANRRKKSEITSAQSQAARRELNHLFSGENNAPCELLYKQGLDDIIHRRKSSVPVAERFRDLEMFANTLELRIFGFMADFVDVGHTPASLFYIHVENLTAAAYAQFDKSSEH